jgi:hypothetical protein
LVYSYTAATPVSVELSSVPDVTTNESTNERKKIMRYAVLIAAGSALACVVGCASPREVAIEDPVGPAPLAGTQPAVGSALQVYSARSRSYVDVNREEFMANNEFGKNDFLYKSAHTDYTIYSQDGKVLREVHNARGPNDPDPAVVPLPPGKYEIEAHARDFGMVKLPVVIERGRLTVVNLQRQRKQVPDSAPRSELVLLGQHRVVGWKATTTTGAESR